MTRGGKDQSRIGRTRPNLSSSTGFTFTELLLTLSGAMILAGVAIPSVRTVMDSYRLTMAAQTIVNHLQYSRMKAVSSNEIIQVIFPAGQTTYTVRAATGETIRGPYALPDGIQWNASDGGQDVTFPGRFVSFQPVGNLPAAGNGSAGRVKLLGRNGIRVDIVVDTGGIVRQTPAYKSPPAPF